MSQIVMCRVNCSNSPSTGKIISTTLTAIEYEERTLSLRTMRIIRHHYLQQT